MSAAMDTLTAPAESDTTIRTCENCGAKVPAAMGGWLNGTKFVCCPVCVFHPTGCRCRFGEFAMQETYLDPDFDEDEDGYGDGDDWGDWEED